MKDAVLKMKILKVMIDEVHAEWKETIWSCDLDDYYCCNGKMCGCGGQSIREVWAGLIENKSK